MTKLFLGRTCDPGTLAPTATHALLDSRKLVKHGVILGMTGSGKTGLAVCLLEEVALSGVPILAVDPKGDLGNLALRFPELRPEDFEPWIDPAEARRREVDVPTRAAQVAASWRKGHDAWDVTEERRRAFAACPVTVYTPGSTAGVPIDVLGSLDAPPPALRDDAEGVAELAAGTVTALLGLVGVSADPMRDPPAIVLTQILVAAWAAGEGLSIEALLGRLVDPPFGKVGVFPLEDFFPRKHRADLAMQLNAVVASPAFAPWTQGVALDLDAMLAPAKHAPIHVFSTAHLDEAQRSFFLATLLNALVAWSRRQPGTGDLRALLYMDEVYGTLPPHPRNPPTKKPVLTLMKQARAVGVGVVLATQNPVDLDYAALSNAGTWLVGRLQTQQDRDKVVDGLASAGGALDRGQLSDWLGRMPERTFVHRDAGEPEPTILHARWAMSYLRGPLTRAEVQTLPKPEIPERASSSGGGGPEGFLAHPPPAPGGVTVRFLAPAAADRVDEALRGLRAERSPDGKPVYAPAAWARVTLRFTEGRSFRHEAEIQRILAPLGADASRAAAVDLHDVDVLSDPPAGWFSALPDEVDEAREIKALQAALVDHLCRTEAHVQYRLPALKLTSDPDEERPAFEARALRALQERADAEIAKLADRTRDKIDRLEQQIEKKRLAIDQAKGAARAQQVQEALNVGEMLFGMFLGGRKKSLSTAVSRRRASMAAGGRVDKNEQDLELLEQQAAELQAELAGSIAEITSRELGRVAEIEEHEVRLERRDVQVGDFVLLWVPVG